MHCDNISVVGMIWKNSSGCKHCMQLIRKLVLFSLKNNTRVFVKPMGGIRNEISDSLSRLQFHRFNKLCHQKKLSMDKYPTPLSPDLWPASKFWTP